MILCGALDKRVTLGSSLICLDISVKVLPARIPACRERRNFSDRFTRLRQRSVFAARALKACERAVNEPCMACNACQRGPRIIPIDDLKTIYWRANSKKAGDPNPPASEV